MTNVALGGQSGKVSKAWAAMLDTTLNDAARSAGAGPGGAYELVGTRFLVGVNIAVFVKSSLRPHVGGVQDAEAPVGMMGVMGNKGGVSLRMRLFDSTFCFVCAHLAAHRNAVAQRNADFAAIMAKTEFRDDSRAEAAAAAAARGLAVPELGRVGILDHDFVVWFGDFNYRIVETVSTEKCFELACGGDGDLEQLRVRDQLNIERAAQRSFHGFAEGPLTFRPTYKFQPGTSLYEQRPDKKLRAPAWCDRVLWRTGGDVEPRHFRQLYYGSVDELCTSDHKPVHALFEVAVKTVQPDRRRAVMSDITRKLDAMENRAMPRVALSDTVLHMADVVYGVPAARTLTISNVGGVAATWRFVPKPEEKFFCKTWMTVEPAYGMIVPGDKVTITVTVNVDDAVARDISQGRELALPSLVGAAAGAAAGAGAGAPGAGGPAGAAGAAGALGAAPAAAAGALRPYAPGAAASGLSVTDAAVGGLLEDILVLRMERGRDYYVSVSAAVLPTCFGCSLAQLARRPEPMRALSLTAAATAAINAAAGVAFGTSPHAAGASAAGGAGGSGVPALSGAPDLAAGPHTLTSMLGGDPADLAPLASPAAALDFDAPSGTGRAAPGGMGAASTFTGGVGASHPLSSSDVSRQGSALMSVPKEIWRLVDALWARGMDARGIFLAPGNAADVLAIREALDTGDALPPTADPLALAQVLTDLLESLREPVIACAFFPGPEFRTTTVEAWTAGLLRAMAPLHYNVLVYIVRFGREVLAHAHANGASIEDLAFVLSRCMMRRIPHDEAPAHAPLDPAAGAGGAGGAGEGMSTGAGSSGGNSGSSSSGGGGWFGGGKGDSKSAAARDASGGAGGGGDEEEGAALARLSLYADKGTRWEPTREEQDAMTRIFTYLLTHAPLA